MFLNEIDLLTVPAMLEAADGILGGVRAFPEKA
jgi:hypothetical protein